MPLYTYRCNQCDHEFEVRQRMVDDALTECPVCGGGVRRVVSSVGVVFKGSGFYVTDNRTSNVNGGSKSSQSKSSERDTDTKSAKSTPAKESGSSGGSNSSGSGDGGSSSKGSSAGDSAASS